MDIKILEKNITKIAINLRRAKEEIAQKDDIIQSKELEIIEFNTKLKDDQAGKKLKEDEIKSLKEEVSKKTQEIANKTATAAATTRKEQDDKRLYALQKDNSALLEEKIESVKRYNDLLVKYNTSKEENRKMKGNLFELKHSVRGSMRSTAEYEGKPHHTMSTIVTQNDELLEKLRGLLKVQTPQEIFVAVQKLLKVLNAVPQMEQFIKNICKVVLDAEGGVTEQIEAVVPTLKKWKESISNMSGELAFYKSIVMLLEMLILIMSLLISRHRSKTCRKCAERMIQKSLLKTWKGHIS